MDPVSGHSLDILWELSGLQSEIINKQPNPLVIPPELQPIMIAANGLMEEVHEYINSLGIKPWRPNPLPEESQLEELVDVLFFYLEMVHFSPFTWERIIAKYHEKWKINMERYRKAVAGDYSWDDKGTKGEL